MSIRHYTLHVTGYNGSPREYLFFTEKGRDRAANRYRNATRTYYGKRYLLLKMEAKAPPAKG